jgi:hypothetical protein
MTSAFWWVLRYIVLWSIAQAAIQVLSAAGIHPDRWVAFMLGKAATPENLLAISWMLAGIAALVAVTAWEVLQLSNRISVYASKRWPHIERLPSRQPWSRKLLLGWGLIILCSIGLAAGVALVFLENRRLDSRADIGGSASNAASPIITQSIPAASSVPTAATEVPRNPSDRFGDLSVLSNAALRRLTIEFCGELRNFEANLRSADWSDSPVWRPDATKEENLREWNARNDRSLQRSIAARTTFSNTYVRDMVALRAEITARLQRAGILLPKPAGYDVAAFEGRLAGPDPITAAANYLEDIARKLS